MVNLRELAIGYPNQLFFEISELEQKQSWTRAQKYSNPTTRCQAHLNYLCWKNLSTWLKSWLEEDDISETNNLRKGLQKNNIPDSYLPEIWEFVNGSLMDFPEVKLALIPSETSDLEEFDIPQEWVDIPQWQADYYLAIQVNLDVPNQSWMRVRGYISHQQLRKKGEYEPKDRYYYISQKYLEEDITEILLSPQQVTQTKQELVTQTELSLTTANQLLDRLGNPSVYSPRLVIPFPQWAMFVTNSQWRQKLYQKRTGLAKVFLFSPQAVNLRQWLQKVVSTIEEGWQTVETLFTPLALEPIPVRGDQHTEETITKDAITPLIHLLKPNNPEKERAQAAGVLGKIGAGYPEVIEALTELLDTAKEEETRWEAALSLGKIDPDNPHGGITKGKLIDLGLQLEDQKIVLIIAIAPKDRERIGVWIQLKPTHQLTKLPANIQLKVISEGNILLEVESRSHPDGTGKDECIQLRFTPPSGTDFQVQVTFNNASFTESFIT